MFDGIRRLFRRKSDADSRMLAFRSDEGGCPVSAGPPATGMTPGFRRLAEGEDGCPVSVRSPEWMSRQRAARSPLPPPVSPPPLVSDPYSDLLSPLNPLSPFSPLNPVGVYHTSPPPTDYGSTSTDTGAGDWSGGSSSPSGGDF